MIIVCNNCNKQFEVASNLIPNEGRLLQCSSCSYKWFFKKKIPINIKKKRNLKNIIIDEKSIIATENKKEIKINNKLNILNFILIFIISFIALIIIVDTFKKPISSFMPNIEFILKSLYETIKDIYLFLKDLL